MKRIGRAGLELPTEVPGEGNFMLGVYPQRQKLSETLITAEPQVQSGYGQPGPGWPQ